MSFSSFLQLIRWKNVVLMTYLLVVLNWIMIPELGGNPLEIKFFIVFALAVVAILAGGNCINDIFDREIDRENKPEQMVLTDEKSIESAKSIYKTLNVIGIGAGIWFGMQLGIPSLSFAFIIPALLLFIYSKRLKATFILGNTLVSFLVMFPILILGTICFETIPIEIILLSSFVFIMNLIREIVKDCEDIKGDYKYQCKTIPIILGTSRAVKIIRFLLVIVVLSLISILYLVNENTLLKIYLLTLLIIPLIWMAYKLNSEKKIWNFKALSTQLKWMFFLGINCVFFI